VSAAASGELTAAPRIAVIGTGGHGGKHLAHAVRLHEQGRVRLAATADPNPPASDLVPEGTPCHPDGLALFAAEQVEIAVVSTPIQTHFDIASAAVRAGADLLLEKPTTATLVEYDALVALAREHGTRIQVGFQSLGCAAIPAIRERVAAGEIGEVVRYSAAGAWVRDEAYWRRARWAGKRALDGVVVADGVLTNPLAHATATALALAGATGRDDITGIQLDLYRANPIEADDTSVAILGLRDGRRLTTAVTLAAAHSTEPFVDVVGDRGTFRLFYKIGVVHTLDADGVVRREEVFGFGDLLENLLENRAQQSHDGAHTGPARLYAPIAETGAFMRLVEAVVTAPAPIAIDGAHVDRHSDESGIHLVVRGVEDAIAEAIRTERTFAQLGAPFAAGTSAADQAR